MCTPKPWTCVYTSRSRLGAARWVSRMGFGSPKIGIRSHLEAVLGPKTRPRHSRRPQKDPKANSEAKIVNFLCVFNDFIKKH